MTADALHLHDLAAVEQHLAGDGLRLLQVGSRSCGVCHALRPRVLALAAEFGQVHPAIVERMAMSQAGREGYAWASLPIETRTQRIESMRTTLTDFAQELTRYG